MGILSTISSLFTWFQAGWTRQGKEHQLLEKCHQWPEAGDLQEEEEEEEDKAVDMRIRELQNLIPNSTTLDAESTLDEAIEYLMSLQSEHQALLEQIKSLDIAVNDHLAKFQRLQLPVEPTINHGISFPNDRADMSCYSPLFPSFSIAVAHSPPLRAPVLPWIQETAALPGHPAQVPHPRLNLQYGIPVMPPQPYPVAGNLSTSHQNHVQPAAANQEANRN